MNQRRAGMLDSLKGFASNLFAGSNSSNIPLSKLQEVISQFPIGSLNGTPTLKKGGNTNITLEIPTTEDLFIIQKIMYRHASSTESVMHNMSLTSKHIQNKMIQKGIDPTQHTVVFVYSKKGFPYYKDDEGVYWRVMYAIKNTTTCKTFQNPEQLYETGKLAGQFHLFAHDLSPNQLEITIPHYNDWIRYYEMFQNTINQSSPDQLTLVQKLFSEHGEGITLDSLVDDTWGLASILQEVQYLQISPTIVNNDMWRGNILFSTKTEMPVALIDFERIQPETGVSAHLADMGKFVATTLVPLDIFKTDQAPIHVKIDFLEPLIKGYWSAARDILTKGEVHNLGNASIGWLATMAFRYVEDHFENNTRYAVSFDGENILRALKRFKFLKEMLDNKIEMEKNN